MMIGALSIHCRSNCETLQRVRDVDWHRGEEGLVFLRGTDKGSSGTKIGFAVRSSRQAITAEVRV
jgi:acetolactate synthase regulatory subunit